MINWDKIAENIASAIKANGIKAITGQLLQEVLLDMLGGSQGADAESIDRDKKLQELIAAEGLDLDELTKRVNELAKQQQIQAENIETNRQDLAELKRLQPVQNQRLDKLEEGAADTQKKIEGIEAKDQKQDGRLDLLETFEGDTVTKLAEIIKKNLAQDDEISALKENAKRQNLAIQKLQDQEKVQDEKITKLEQETTAQDGKISEIQQKDLAQDKKLDTLEKGKADKIEINEYNISAINGTPYAGLQEAIKALDTYLTAQGVAKSVGVKVTYVQADIMRAKTYSFVKMGRFTDVANWADEPLGGYMRGFYEQAILRFGGRFNESTGFYEYAKLTDITTPQMGTIVAAGRITTQNAKSAFGIEYIRANLLCSMGYNPSYTTISNAFYYVTSLESVVLALGQANIGDTLLNAFCAGCEKLKYVLGKMNVTAVTGFKRCFEGCGNLREVNLFGLGASINLESSPLLNVAQDGETGLGYMITNANPAGGFTITLAKALEQNPDVIYWVGEAQKKNITIAFA